MAYEVVSGELKKQEPLVCKMVERSKLSMRAERMIKNEIANLGLVNSKSVINMRQYYKTQQAYYIFSDFCNGGDVSQLMAAKGGKLREEEARVILSKIVAGVEDLHSAHILHRDLKLPNILIHFKTPLKIGNMELTQEDLISFEPEEMAGFLQYVDLLKVDFDVKIGDLGFSKFVSNTNNLNFTICGTPLFMSP